MQSDIKSQLIKSYQAHLGDTGSPAVQIAIFSEKIKDIQAHLKVNPKDIASRIGLLQLTNKRRKELQVLFSQDFDKFVQVVGELNLERDAKKITARNKSTVASDDRLEKLKQNSISSVLDED